MPYWLILADWIVAISAGIPSALALIAVGAFYLLRPKDAQLAGIAGYAAFFFSLLGLIFAGLFALAAWGGSRNTQWAVYVQILALLCALLPAQAIRNASRARKRSRY